MPIQLFSTLSLGATGYTPWFVINGILGNATLQISVPATGSPVGVWSIEFSNDLLTIDAETRSGVSPANSAARRLAGDCTVLGDAWDSGFDGTADRNTMAMLWPCPGAIRMKWTSTSGTGTASIFVAGG